MENILDAVIHYRTTRIQKGQVIKYLAERNRNRSENMGRMTIGDFMRNITDRELDRIKQERGRNA